MYIDIETIYTEDKPYNYYSFYCDLYCIVYAKYTKDVYVKLKKILG